MENAIPAHFNPLNVDCIFLMLYIVALLEFFFNI